MRRVKVLHVTALASVVVTAASCEQILGLDRFHNAICTPGKVKSDDCPYPGPTGTKEVGICKPGVRVCAEDGLSWGACSDPVLPKAEEDCSTPEDDNCDGQVNEASAGCCEPGSMPACYSGPDGTEGVGICAAGTQVCGKSGKPEGACTGDVRPAQETCADTRDENCDGHDCVEWASLLGDPSEQSIGGLAVDGKGNIIVTGVLHGSIALGAGATLKEAGGGDAFIIKLDPAGKVLWGQRFGDADEQAAGRVSVDSTGDIFLGGTSASAFVLGDTPVPSGVFITKLDGTDGHVVWAKGLQGACPSLRDTSVNTITVTAQNDVVLGGAFCTSIDFGDGPVTSFNGGQDGFVALLRGGDGSGKKGDGYWGRNFNSQTTLTSTSVVTGVAIAKDGHILATGDFKGSIFLGTGYGEDAVDEYDVFVAEFRPDGSPETIDSYGTTGDQQASAITVGADGSYFLTGLFRNSIDLGGGPLAGTDASAVFVTKFSFVSNLYYEHQWSRRFGDGVMGGGLTTSLSMDPSGRLVLAGLFAGDINFGTGVLSAGTNFNMFLAKLDDMGNGIWARQFENTLQGSYPFATGVASVAPTGESILAGVAPSPIDFGTGLLTPAGPDAFIAKFGH